jgi:hypothetical protein
LPLDLFVTIQWSKVSYGGRVQERLGRLCERLYQWLLRRGVALTHVYVHEVGSLREINTHIMVHVPRSVRREFEKMIPQWLDSPACEGLVDVREVNDHDGLTGHFLKGMEREAARALGILRCLDQGKIRGKRCGTSENIGRKARNEWGKTARIFASSPPVAEAQWGRAAVFLHKSRPSCQLLAMPAKTMDLKD